ncbi:MAG TPA: MBL fold metallo-hydrolase, partial [Luteolibacter sp.]|nr:MBL fold metallo-hydrolase [Luteolibacter sp.]
IETPEGNLLIDAPEGVDEWLENRGVRVDHVLLTHQHYDHVEGAAAMQAAGAKLHAFAPYSTTLTLEEPARQWGMPIRVTPYTIDAFIKAGSFEIAGLQFTAAHLPGHATDGMIFHLPAAGVVFAGDTLFAGSIGRPDLPGGDQQLLLDGIARHLLTLPPQTRVLSGHGPETTIGREAAGNPFLR